MKILLESAEAQRALVVMAACLTACLCLILLIGTKVALAFLQDSRTAFTLYDWLRDVSFAAICLILSGILICTINSFRRNDKPPKGKGDRHK